MVAGFRRRDESTWTRTAWSVAHLLNVSGKTLKRRVTVARLLGRVIKSSEDD